MNIHLLALFAGRSKSITACGSSEWWDQPWESGIFKEALPGAVWLSYGGIQGDEQADRNWSPGTGKCCSRWNLPCQIQHWIVAFCKF